MNDDEIAIAIAIVENVALLECVMDFEDSTIKNLLECSLRDIFEKKTKKFMWEGESAEPFEEVCWLGSQDWRATHETTDGEYDLYFLLDFFGNSWTYTSHFVGVGDAGIRLSSSSDTLKKRELRAVLAENGDIVQELVASGFIYDGQNNTFSIPIVIAPAIMVKSFMDDDMDPIMDTIGERLQRIYEARETLSKLAAKIRERADRRR